MQYNTHACTAPISDLWATCSIRCCTCTRTSPGRALCCAPDTVDTCRPRRRICTCPEDRLKKRKKKITLDKLRRSYRYKNLFNHICCILYT